jgi:hypothetical protein
MRKIYEEDQKNRSDVDGDTRRRAQVRQLIDEGQLQSAEDYYYATLIFQCGQKPSDYLYAHAGGHGGKQGIAEWPVVERCDFRPLFTIHESAADFWHAIWRLRCKANGPGAV